MAPTRWWPASPTLLGTGLIEAFAGLTLAIGVLTALLAFGALERLSFGWRTLAAAATALPYLIAAYLAQEAFKEPIMALFLLAFALWLPRVERARDGAVLGLLAGGTIYVYSFPGLAWLAGTALAWGAVELIRSRTTRRNLARIARAAAGPVAVAVAVVLVLVVTDLDRLREFADFRALDPDRANDGGLGNLPGHISPLEALGLWPTSEFRLSAGAGSLPALVFYAGALLAFTALALGTPRWIRANGWSVPAALGAAIADLRRSPRLRHRLHVGQGPGGRRSPHHPDGTRRTSGSDAQGGLHADRRRTSYLGPPSRVSWCCGRRRLGPRTTWRSWRRSGRRSKVSRCCSWAGTTSSCTRCAGRSRSPTCGTSMTRTS